MPYSAGVQSLLKRLAAVPLRRCAAAAPTNRRRQDRRRGRGAAQVLGGMSATLARDLPTYRGMDPRDGKDRRVSGAIRLQGAFRVSQGHDAGGIRAAELRVSSGCRLDPCPSPGCLKRFAVAAAPGAASVRVWPVMSRDWGPRGGRAVPVGVHVDYPPCENLLRMGIRGATEREVLASLDWGTGIE
jgi:hypothetical protein